MDLLVVVGRHRQRKGQVLHILIDIPPLWLSIVVTGHLNVRQHYLAVEDVTISGEMELVGVVPAV